MTQQNAPAPADQQPEPVVKQSKPISSYAGLFVAGGFVLIAIIVLLVWAFRSAPAPTMLTPDMLKMQTITVNPTSFLDISPLQPGNAGDDYQQAVQRMADNKSLISKVIGEKSDADETEEDYGVVGRRRVTKREMMPAAVLAILKQIAADVESGAGKAKMEYTFVHTPRRFHISDKFVGAEELHKLSSALDTLGAYYLVQKNKAAAKKVFEAEFVLGWHMMREHAHPDMLRRGLSVQGMGLDGLQEVYRDQQTDRVRAIQDYRLKAAQLEQRFVKKHKAIWRSRQFVGDIFYVAQHDDDPAWRVQAILALGLVRYAGESGSDRELAVKTLQDYTRSSNPYFAAAAEAALSLTREQFNQVGAGHGAY